MRCKSDLIAFHILLFSFLFHVVLPDEVLIDYVEESTALEEQHIRFVMQEVGKVVMFYLSENIFLEFVSPISAADIFWNQEKCNEQKSS